MAKQTARRDSKPTPPDTGVTPTLLTIYLVLTIGGKFEAAFGREEDARRYILRQPGRFNSFDVTEAEVEL